MAWLAVDKDRAEHIYSDFPKRHFKLPFWWNPYGRSGISIPKGSIEKLICKKLTWDDEPIEI